MKSELLDEYSRKLALTYGEKCKATFVALAEQAGPDAALEALVDEAVERTYANQASAGEVDLGALRFNSK